MNYYEILEVSVNASKEVIKNAYRALIKKYHPDSYKGNKEYAEEMIKKINEAYEVLSDENKRLLYDYDTGVKINPEEEVKDVRIKEDKKEVNVKSNESKDKNKKNGIKELLKNKKVIIIIIVVLFVLSFLLGIIIAGDDKKEDETTQYSETKIQEDDEYTDSIDNYYPKYEDNEKIEIKEEENNNKIVENNDNNEEINNEIIDNEEPTGIS